MLERRWVRWLAILGVWFFLALFFASQAYMSSAYRERPITFRQAMVFPAVNYSIWAALTPLILWLARRFPLEGRKWPRDLLVHLPAAVVFALGQLLIFVQVLPHVYGNMGRPVSPREIFRNILPGNFHLNVLMYAAIVGTARGVAYYRKFRDRELKTSQLQARLAQTQLQVLRMQLQPHFLFNTLHTISALMHEDVEAADRMMARLSDLLRLTLESAGAQEVALRQELDFLQRYLEIEQTRFGERLKIRQEIDPETLDAQVPYLILQPLVENAIRHGVAPRSAGGRIEIHAWRDDSWLRLEIRDDGAGLTEGAADALREGLGLSNTRARLAQLYGPEHRFELRNAASGGLQVSLTLPFRTGNGPATEASA